MSLLDRSKWEQLQAQCWREFQDRRAKRICLKCGIYEKCTINKIYAKDGETIKKYVIDCQYEYKENTNDSPTGDICRHCQLVMHGNREARDTGNRQQIEELFRDIQKNEAHDLFLIISNRPEMNNTLPAFKRKLNRLPLEPISEAERAKREQEYNAVIASMREKIKSLETEIDKKIVSLL